MKKIQNINNLPPKFCDAIIQKAKGKDIDLSTTVFEHPDDMTDNSKRKFTKEENFFLREYKTKLAIGDTNIFIY